MTEQTELTDTQFVVADLKARTALLRRLYSLPVPEGGRNADARDVLRKGVIWMEKEKKGVFQVLDTLEMVFPQDEVVQAVKEFRSIFNALQRKIERAFLQFSGIKERQ
jgi:hypothetical protein